MIPATTEVVEGFLELLVEAVAADLPVIVRHQDRAGSDDPVGGVAGGGITAQSHRSLEGAPSERQPRPAPNW
jgi:hypothetical protein